MPVPAQDMGVCVCGGWGQQLRGQFLKQKVKKKNPKQK